VPLETSMRSSGLPDQLVGPNFYDRREIKDMLAYVRVLVDPDDDVSARRIVNRPKRGIGGRSVSRLATWAKINDVSFSDAIDRAAEVGLDSNVLPGAEQLSELLAELRPLVHTMGPADLVQLVAERTGYKAELVAEHTHESDGRIQHLSELATKAGHFDDVTEFLEAVALAVETDGLDPATSGPHSDADRPDPASSPPRPGRTRRARSQVLIGCLGLALFALGATLATVPALKDWTPPPELSVATSTTGRSVAEVQLGSAGPVAATLEVRNGGRAVWRSSLARTTAAQSVDLPTGLLNKRSRVVLATEGHTLRRVDS